MKNLLKSKIVKVLGLGSVVSGVALYQTGYLDDVKYLLGGVRRGLRCARAGSQIVYTYMNKGINEETHDYAAKKLYECFRKNAGCYIKLGQIICQLEHIIPLAYSRELEPLCMECPVSDFDSIKKVLEREYKKPIEEVFVSIDPVPLGSASLAQVHKGVLKDGSVVAIKVQHRHIPYHCPGDILIVRIGCAIAEKLFPDFKYRWLGKEFQDNLPKEIDFHNEGRNAEKIKQLLIDDDRVVIPKIYWDYTTNKILVMSYEVGKPITNMKYIKENKIEIKEIAHILCDIFNRQIFEFGFVHSDPHPGNLFIRKEKVGNKEMTRLVLLDHGLYRDLDEDFRYNYSSLWRGIITQNKDLLIKSCNGLGICKVELFMSILTSNTYDTLMDQNNKYSANRRMSLKSNILYKTKKEQERLKKYAAIYHKDITHVLNDVRREMLLLLKINEFLRNIDRRMGSPMNTFENMMQYIYTEIKKFEKEKNSFWDNLWLSFEYYKYIFLFEMVKVYFTAHNFFYKSKEEKEEDQNAEKVFEFEHLH